MNMHMDMGVCLCVEVSVIIVYGCPTCRLCCPGVANIGVKTRTVQRMHDNKKSMTQLRQACNHSVSNL